MPNPNPFLRSPLTDVADDANANVIAAAQQQAPVDEPIPALPVGPTTTAPAPVPVKAAPQRAQSLTPPPELNDVFEASAKAYGVPVNVLMALAHQESGYNPAALGQDTKYGKAQGIMQFLGSTAKGLGIDPLDPNQAIPAAAKQLSDRLKAGASMDDAIMEHFAGPDRSGWKDKTAAYGKEVLDKAGQIGAQLYGPVAAAPDAPAFGANLDPNKLSTSMSKMDYLADFMKVNPDASADAQKYVMDQYDKAAAERTKQSGSRVQDKFAQMASPDATFNAKLNAKLQAGNQGVAQVLPSNQQPSKLSTPAQDPGLLKTIGANITGGALGTLTGALSAGNALIGDDAAAKEYDEGKQQIQAVMNQNGGESLAGKASALVGGVAPALAVPAEAVPQIVANAGLFAIPAYRDTYKQQIEMGRDKTLAMAHAAAAFGINMLAPTVAAKGMGAIAGRLGTDGLAGAGGAATAIGQAAVEGAGFSVANTVIDKGIDTIAGQKNDNAWLDPHDMAASALGFAALRGGHALAAGVGGRSPVETLPADATPEQRIAAAQEHVAEIQQQPAPRTQNAAEVVGARPEPDAPQDQFVIQGEDGSTHILNPDGTLVESVPPPAPAGPLTAALGDAMKEHAANPQPIIEAPRAPEPVAPPEPPAIESLPTEALKSRLDQVSASIKEHRTLELVAERKKLTSEIKARNAEAVAASKPAEEPATMGPFDERSDANRMMIRAAESTGVAHEVVEKSGKFEIQPLKESGNDVPGRSDDGGSGNRPADSNGIDNGARLEGNAVVSGDGRSRDASGRSEHNGSDNPSSSPAADGKPALKEWEKNPYSAYTFSTPEAADAFFGKKGIDRNQFEAVQHGDKKWKVQPIEPASDSSVIAKPAAKAVRKPRVVSKGDKPEPRVIDEEGYLAENGASRQDFGDAALHRSSSNVGESTKRNAIERQSKKDTALAARREELRTEYAAKVASGELRAPTSGEETARIAKGNPDSEATQAAQRLIEKRARRAAERASKQESNPELTEKVLAPAKVKKARAKIAANDVPELYDLNKSTPLSSDSPLGREDMPKRVMVLSELKRLQKLRERGRVPTEYVDARMKSLIAKIGERNEAKEDARLKDKERGPEWVQERLMRAKRKGELDGDAVDFALWALRKSPSLGNDLAISVRAANEQGTSGSYRSADRLMTLFKDGGNTGTAVHEILHHSERMMPGAIQDGVNKAWQRAYSDAWDKANTKQRTALETMIEASAGSKSAHKELVKAFNDGTLKYDEHYQLTNASEFWAVNATRIMAGRYEGVKGGWVAKAKQWLSEMGQYVKGALGLKSDAAVLKGLNEVLNGDGKKVSPKMLFDGQGELRDIADPAQQPDLTPDEQGPLRKLQAAVQNNLNRVVQVQDRIAKLTGAKPIEQADYMGAETNRPGRIAARLEDAQDHMLEPLMERLAKSKHTPDDLQELLHAMHADERNAAVAKINPKFDPASPDYEGGFGSGMSGEKAAEIIERYKDAGDLQEMAQTARDIAQATLDLKEAYGLITPEMHKTLVDAYENYVPLKGDGEYGPKVKRAMGHEERDEQIMGNIARDYAQAIVVGEKNLARQSLLQLVLRHPDDALWTARVPPKGRYVAGTVFNVSRDGRTEAAFTNQAQVAAFLEGKGAEAHNYAVNTSAGEQVVEFTKPLQDNEVMVYVKGQSVRLQIHDEALARQLRPLNNGQMNVAMEALRSLNRHLSKVYTGYNPSFILRNTARDALTGSINMVGNQGAVIAAKAWSKYPASAAALAKWAIDKKIPSGRAGEYLKEYRDQGGKVGASWMSDLEAQGKSLTQMYDSAQGFAKTAMETGVSRRTVAVGWHKTVGKLAHIVEVANTATENALRLSLFAAMREAGHSPAKAAQAAKTVTVDFDRKGASTPSLGAFYLFLNPAIQGTANLTKTLAQGQHRYQAWAAVGGLATLGYMLASKGMTDDKDRWLGNGWEKRSKTFMYQTGNHQVTIPVSQEYAPFFAFGTAMAEVAHGESKMGAATRVFSSFVDAYFPLNGVFNPESDNHGQDLRMALMPTVLKPYDEIWSNRNSFGSKVVPEGEFTKDRPDNLKMNRNTKNSMYDKAAQVIAEGGVKLGAGKYENDITKVSPEVLQLLWRTYTGGLGTFIADSTGAVGMAKSDFTQMDSADFPIIKDFYRPIDAKPIQGRYMNMTQEARAAISEFGLAAKAGDGEEITKIMGDSNKARFLGMTKLISTVSKASGQLADEAVDVNADKTLTGAEKRARLKDIDARKEELYRTGISAFQ